MRALALASLLALLAAACGGSSSETPPPLEPDPESSRYTGPRLPAAEEAPKVAPEAEPEPRVDEPARAARPARSTWGGGAKPSSPTAPLD